MTTTPFIRNQLEGTNIKYRKENKTYFFSLGDKPKKIKKAVMVYGRFNPMHSGHERMIDLLKDIAKDKNADAYLFTSKSWQNEWMITDKKIKKEAKNPLSPQDKVKYLIISFGGSPIKEVLAMNNPIDAFSYLIDEHGYNSIDFIVGTDRMNSFISMALWLLSSKENDSSDDDIDELDETNPIDFLEIGLTEIKRDSSSDSPTKSMSATKMRKLAVDNKKDEFIKNLPRQIKENEDAAEELFLSVRNEMKIHSEKLQSKKKKKAKGVRTTKKYIRNKKRVYKSRRRKKK